MADEDNVGKFTILKLGGGTASTIAKGLLALAGLTIAGVVIYKIWPREKDVTGSMDLEVTPGQTTVAPGTVVMVTVAVTNIGEEAISPRLRFDLKAGTGGLTTVNENPDGFQPFGDIEPGETVTKEMSMTVPANWSAGTIVYGRLVCAGHEGTLWTNQVATVISTQDYVETITATLAGLEKKCVDVGQRFTYSFQVYNSSNSPLSVTYTVGFRSQGFAEQYQEKDNIVVLSPGANNVKVYSLAAPASESGHIIDFRVRQGTALVYEGDNVAYIGPSKLQPYSSESFVISMTPTDRLVSKSGGAVSFVLGFKHVGPAKVYKAGVYINDPYNTVDHKPYWITQTFSCPEDPAVETRQVTITGVFRPTELNPGRVVDCMMAFMESNINPSVPKVDSQLLFANWDSIITIKT